MARIVIYAGNEIAPQTCIEASIFIYIYGMYPSTWVGARCSVLGAVMGLLCNMSVDT